MKPLKLERAESPRPATVNTSAGAATPGAYPAVRMRRNRKAGWSRRLVAENVLTTADLIWPIFLMDTPEARTPVAHMPGVDRLNIAEAQRAAEQAAKLGIPAVAPFPYVDRPLRDPRGSEAVKATNLMCRAVRAIKEAVPEIGVITDVALDPYTSHGHDGVLDDRLGSKRVIGWRIPSSPRSRKRRTESWNVLDRAAMRSVLDVALRMGPS